MRINQAWVRVGAGVGGARAADRAVGVLTTGGRFGGVDGGRGGDEGGEEEGAQGAVAMQGRALRRQVLTAAHAAGDLEVQRLGLLLGSGEGGQRESRRNNYTQARIRAVRTQRPAVTR